MEYIITGKVIKGDGYGRKLGFPTMNLENDGKHLPEYGIYSGNAMLGGKKYRAAIVIASGNKVEAHLLGYSGDAYGQEVSLELTRFLREYRKFGTEEELIKQIKEDILQC